MSDRVRMLFAITVIAVVLAALVAGFAVLRSPAEERIRRIDERRIDDLRTNASAIRMYHYARGELPGSLEDLAKDPGPRARLVDPETTQPYEYRVLAPDRYELCAVFSLDADTGMGWAHGSGRQCFALAARERSPAD